MQSPLRSNSLLGSRVETLLTSSGGGSKPMVTASMLLNQGVVIAVDVPFSLIRSLGTLLMTRMEGTGVSTIRQEFEILLNTSVGGKIYRYALVNLVTELASYTLCLSEASSMTQQDSSSSSGVGESVGLQVFSIPDHNIDHFWYKPFALSKAKLHGERM